MVQTPHDALFKFAFSQVEHAAGVIRSVLPVAVVEQLDFATLTHRPGSFVDANLSPSHTDILFSANLAGHPVLLYLLLEHQSTVDRWMPFRMHGYMDRIWADWLKDHKDARLLPAIIPIVVHHSDTGWTGPRALEDLLALPSDAREALGTHLPRLTLLIDDLTTETDEQLRARAMTAFGRLVLFSLRDARTPGELQRKLASWADLLRELAGSRDGLAALGVLMRYYQRVSKLTSDQLEVLIRTAAGEEVMEAMKTGLDWFIADAKLEARTEGRIEGRIEGELIGERRLLTRQLTARFGELPPAVATRLDAATREQLENWAERLLSANTLAEVFGDA